MGSFSIYSRPRASSPTKRRRCNCAAEDRAMDVVSRPQIGSNCSFRPKPAEHGPDYDLMWISQVSSGAWSNRRCSVGHKNKSPLLRFRRPALSRHTRPDSSRPEHRKFRSKISRPIQLLFLCWRSWRPPLMLSKHQSMRSPDNSGDIGQMRFVSAARTDSRHLHQ
jgi:hypothetical protein